MPTIIFNGKSYSNIDDMPPDVRQAYQQAVGIFADRNQNGIPDVFEEVTGKEEIDLQSTSIGLDGARVFIDGKAYSSVDEMPADVRQRYEQAMAQVGQALKDADRNNIPDILEGVLAAQSQPPVSDKPAARSMTTHAGGMAEPVVSDATPTIGVWLLIGVALIVLLAAMAVFVMFMLFR